MKRSKLVYFLFTALLTACGGHSSTQHRVQTFEVQAASFKEVLHFTGTLQPISETTLTSPVDGILDRVNYPFGQHVKKGEVVFTVNSQALQKQYNDALTEYLKAKDNFAVAKSKFIGTEDLWKAGIIAKNNYLSEKSNLNTAHVTFMQSLHNLSEIVEKTDTSSTKALTKLNLAEFEKVQKALNKAHHLIDFKAPISGVVLYPPESSDNKTGHLSIGSTIKAGQALALIGDLSGVRVEIDIPEVDIDKISIGVPATITGVAFKQQVLHGKLTAITSQASVANGGTLPSFQAIVEVKHIDKEAQHWIKTGMSAMVELSIQRDEKLMIPIAAIHSLHGENSVRIKLPDGTVREQRVETGDSKVDSVAILKGLKAGDVIVYE